MKKKSKKYDNAHHRFDEEAKLYAEDESKLKSLFTEALDKARHNQSALGDAFTKIPLLIQFVQAWYRKEYTEIPKKTIIGIIAALIYFVSPIDLIPDFILGFGYIDDAAVLGFVFKSLMEDLNKFQAWKDQKDADGEMDLFV